MKKALIDDLGRIVGCIESWRGAYGKVEYGRYDNDGILHVVGIARLVNMSSLSESQKNQALQKVLKERFQINHGSERK